MPPELKTRFVKSVLAFSSSQTLGRIVHSLAYVVLLKKLTPGEIGLVSMAAVFIAILGAVSEAGLGAALIQTPTLTDRQKTGVFWLGVMLAAFSYAALFSAAPWIARYFREPHLESLLRIYLLVLFANALKSVPYSLAVRDLKFGRISLVETASMLISSLLMVGLAFRGFGSWSLVYGELGRVICLFLGIQVSMSYVPGIRFSFRDISPLLRFGSFATGSRILYNFYTNIDYLMVGKFFGATAVGLYTLAYRLVFDPLKAGTGMINQVAYPTFAKLQRDLPRLRRYFFSMARMNLAVLGSFLVIAALFSDWIMLTLGYEEWIPAVPLIRCFCVIGFLRCVSPLIPQLLNALGHSKLNLTYSALCVAVMPLAFYAGARISLLGVAWAWIIVYPLVVSLLFYYALKFLELPIGKFVKEFVSSAKILLVFVPTALAVRWVFDGVISGILPDLSMAGLRLDAEFLGMLAAVLISTALGIIFLFIFDKPIVDELMKALKRKA